MVGDFVSSFVNEWISVCLVLPLPTNIQWISPKPGDSD